MSAIFEGQISTTFASSGLPPVSEWNLGEVVHAQHSTKAPSTTSSDQKVTSNCVSWAEPCFITGRPSFAQERVRWVPRARRDPLANSEVEKHILDLKITREFFDLDSACNMTNIDRNLYVLMEKFALFAVTGSRKTLESLIGLLEKDNARQQLFYDEGARACRFINTSCPPVSDPEYELVALYPEHILPLGSELTVFSPTTPTSPVQLSKKYYVAASDGTLRESPGLETSPRLPPFSYNGSRTHPFAPNPFLIILNAQIKFRRYCRLPPSQRPKLPEDVTDLINLTQKLVDLIYWKPQLQPGTKRARLRAAAAVMGSDHGSSSTNSIFDTPLTTVERELLETHGMLEKQQQHEQDATHTSRSSGFNFLDTPIGTTEHELLNTQSMLAEQQRDEEGTTLEERVEYGLNLLSGRNFELDSDDMDFLDELHLGVPPGAYISDKVEEWRQTVSD